MSERWNEAFYEIRAWFANGLQLQRPNGSVLHQLLDDWRSQKIIVPPDAGKYNPFEHFRSILGYHFHAFVIEHDWARAFKNSDVVFGSEELQFPQPYEHCCFEFAVSNKRVCFISHFGNDYTFSCFVRCNAGWHQVPLKSQEHEPLRKLLYSQHQAVMITLDASVATTSIVRAPERLNRARIKKGKLPLFDYHVVQLAHRTRPDSLPPENETQHVGPRLHFRRGHWRHFETFKTWINWMLVGDPDLGFIDKHYRL